MTGSEIRAYAHLNQTEKKLVADVTKTCADGWGDGKSQFICGATAMIGYLKATGYDFKGGCFENNKEMLIDWFTQTAEHLDKAFPTHHTEKIGNDARGTEIDAVNDEIAKCKRCAEFIKNYM